MMKKMSIKDIARIGVFAAAVYAASAFIQIPIPTAIDNTRLHVGNVMCLLSGMVLGPWQGGLAAGIGSMLFDLTNPAYITSAPFTFIFKFLMAWICGKMISLNKFGLKTRYLIGAISGQFTYVILYLSKSFLEHYFVLEMPMEAIILTLTQKGIVSSINAVIAVLAAIPLGLALRPIISRSSKSM